ncbi:MAG: S1C family serine protease [Acidimicrobiia bacterium]
MSQPELPPFERPRTAPSVPPPPPARTAVPDADDSAPALSRSRSSILLPIVGGLIGSALTVGALWLGGVFDEPSPTPITVDTTPVAAPAQAATEPGDDKSNGTITITPLDGDSRVAAVAARAIPAIVTVEVGDNVRHPSGNDTTLVFRVFATGSGVVFDSNGYILTNNHVVEDSVITKVVFSDGRRYEAELVGRDPLTDIAVLKIDASGLEAIEFADVNQLAIGDEAIAVGSPLGLEGGPSVTAGVISAFNRQLKTGPTENDSLYGLLQTDAPITLGSSGGALLNGQAELIGITTAIGVSDVGAEGLGFAVPVDMVERLAADLIADGIVRHAYLGIGVQDAMIMSEDGVEIPSGALITGFASGSAIQEAGAEVDDVIVEIDGIEINTRFELLSILRSYRAEDDVQIVVTRDGESIEFDMELGLRPDDV